MNVKIYPSLLAADFGNLEKGARAAEEAGADALHLDIMDGHLVPNLSMGPDVVKMAHNVLDIPLSVHLMISNPQEHIKNFADVGATTILIHIEAECNIPSVLEHIEECGVKKGITLNPETPAELIFPVLDTVDEVLCMTVHPGYGGQSFIPDVLPKIRVIREKAKVIGRDDLEIMVDGGINAETAAQCAAAGANIFVAGSSLYRAPDMTSETALIRDKASEAFTL